MRLKAAIADASEAIFRLVLLDMQADVAQTYFCLRATYAELVFLQGTVRTRE